MDRRILLIALLALAACTAVPNMPSPTIAHLAASETPTPLATAYLASPTIATPWPPLQLSSRDNVVISSAISVSWHTERSIHATGRPDFSALATLAVPPGMSLNLDAPGAPRPSAVAIDALTLIGDEIQWGTPAPAALSTQFADETTIFAAPRIPGEYYLHIRMRWGNNEASYGFRLLVAP